MADAGGRKPAGNWLQLTCASFFFCCEVNEDDIWDYDDYGRLEFKDGVLPLQRALTRRGDTVLDDDDDVYDLSLIHI